MVGLFLRNKFVKVTTAKNGLRIYDIHLHVPNLESFEKQL